MELSLVRVSPRRAIVSLLPRRTTDLWHFFGLRQMHDKDTEGASSLQTKCEGLLILFLSLRQLHHV